MEPDFWYEVDTLAVARHFEIFEIRGRWVVKMIPELAGEKGPLPPGQSVRVDGTLGLVAEMSEWSGFAPGNWACRRHFTSQEKAWHMAQEWLKREREDLYGQCALEVREARRYRKTHREKMEPEND